MKNKRMMGFVSFSSGVVIPRVFLSSLVYDFRTAFIYGLLYINQKSGENCEENQNKALKWNGSFCYTSSKELKPTVRNRSQSE